MNRYRKTERGGGLFSAIEHEQAVAARTVGILKLRDVIPWEGFRPLLEELTGYATRDWKKGGKPPFDPKKRCQAFSCCHEPLPRHYPSHERLSCP